MLLYKAALNAGSLALVNPPLAISIAASYSLCKFFILAKLLTASKANLLFNMANLYCSWAKLYLPKSS